nr:MAG TPA: hypothetical protein [Caudoviricetes sp.]
MRRILESLCWTCLHSYHCDCSWVKHLQPIDGWVVKEHATFMQCKGKRVKVNLKRVVKCPQFKEE